MIERFRKMRVARGVLCGVAGNFRGSFSVIVIEEKRLAIGRRGEYARIGAENLAIEFVELEVAGDIGAKRAESVRKSGRVETVMKLFCNGTAADGLAAFQNEGLKAALGKIEGRDESVMAAADKRYALSDRHV